jgi:hypothetical protein
MCLRIDLHTHSTASDGSLTPAELVEHAAAAGIKILALTDHDVTDGLVCAQKAADKHQIQLINGIELSVTWRQRTIHLVGLNIDPEHQPLQDVLTKLRLFRNWRAQEMGRRLEKKGIPGAYEWVSSRVRGEILSRTHFAQFLVEARKASSVSDVFHHYLKPGKPGFVPGEWATLDEALEVMIGAGGQVVIAHPARYKLTMTKLNELIDDFRTGGGHGLEVVSGSHSKDDAYRMANIVKKRGLLASAGSDFHDPERPWIALGRLPQLPDGCKAIWHDWDID